MRVIAVMVGLVACGSPQPPAKPPPHDPYRFERAPALEIEPAPTIPTTPPPLPPAIAREPSTPCTGACCWDLTLLAPEPKITNVQVRVRPGGEWRVVTVANAVPRSPAKHFNQPITEFWSDVDGDGTIVFTGHWVGNPDQAHNIGNGVYRLRGDRAEPIADPQSVMPDVKQRFNVFGIPSVERGKVVFWGGRDGGGPSGIYMVDGGKIVAIAGAGNNVKGSGTPSMRDGAIAFQATENGIPGIYLWTKAAGIQRGLRVGDLGIAHLFDVSLGDGIVFAGVAAQSAERRRIVAWRSGEQPRILVDGDDFKDPQGTGLYLAPEPSARGTRVAFTVGVGRYSEAWIADARDNATCKRERVVASGDVVGNDRIEMISGISRHAFTVKGELILTVVLMDRSVRLLRATPRGPR